MALGLITLGPFLVSGLERACSYAEKQGNTCGRGVDDTGHIHPATRPTA